MDTLGLLLTVIVTAASVKDNDAGRDLLEKLRAEHHRITLVWADGGYTGWLVAFAHAVLALALTVVKRSDDAKGFVVLARRWVVERSFCGHRSIGSPERWTWHFQRSSPPTTTSCSQRPVCACGQRAERHGATVTLRGS